MLKHTINDRGYISHPLSRSHPSGDLSMVMIWFFLLSVSNPSDGRLEYEGYRKVIETDPPDYDPETQRIECHYTEDGNNIRQVWDVIDLPVEESSESI